VDTAFESVGETVVFPENFAAAGFAGLIIDLGVAATTVKWTRTTFRSEGSIAGEDTRAVLDVANTTSTTGLETDLCPFSNFASLNLNTKCFLVNSTFTQCGLIDTGGTGTDPGADISGSSIIEASGVVAVLWDTDHDPVTELANIVFVSDGTGHALELGSNTPATIELVGHDYGTAYAAVDGVTGNEVLYNNSGKAITINITDGATPTVRNGAGASTTVNNPVAYTLTGINTAERVIVVSDPLGVRTVLKDDLPNGSGEFTYSYNYTVDTDIDVSVVGIDNKISSFLDTLTNTTRSFPVPRDEDLFYLNP
jgi:hypothetical protein